MDSLQNTEIYKTPRKDEVQMNSTQGIDKKDNEPGCFPSWYNPDYYRYKHATGIDFFKVDDEFNQAKLKLMILNINKSGWMEATYKVECELMSSYCQKQNEETQIKIDELKKQKTDYLKRQNEITDQENDIKNKYWPANEKNISQNNFKGLEYKIPEKEPFNDPENQFGWKSYCDNRKKMINEYENKPGYDVGEVLSEYIQGGGSPDWDNPQYIEKLFTSPADRWYDFLKEDTLALLEFCKKYFKEDLSQPFYEGLVHLSKD